VPRPVVFLAKSEYFTGKGIKGKLTAAFFRLTNQLPMDRSGGAASALSLNAGMDVLKNGSLLGIYPEGTRSPDARLYRGKVGVARLALAARVPVIPVAMIGTDKVQPIGKRVPNIRRIGMIFGEPLDFSRYYGMEDDRLVQRSVADEIMYELMRLSGQEYVDEYAAVVKLRLAGKSSEPLSAAGDRTAGDKAAGDRTAGDATADAAGAGAGHPAGPAAPAPAAELPEHPAAAGDEGTASSGTA
jgi:1-acyl-sn-glycerol-3-phosphate acyltransferase